MKRSNKKGFTIVELVIVIAVIAILAAVLIPTIAGLVRKANISADKVVAKELNSALALAQAEDEITTFGEVLDALKANGYLIANLNAKADGCYFVWDKGTNQILLVDSSDSYAVLYGENASENKEDWYFAISDPELVVQIKGAGYINAQNTVANGDDLKAAFNKGGETTVYVDESIVIDKNNVFVLDNATANITLDLGNSVISGNNTATNAIENIPFRVLNGSLNIKGGNIKSTGSALDADGEVMNNVINVSGGTLTVDGAKIETVDAVLPVALSSTTATIKNTTIVSGNNIIGTFAGSDVKVENCNIEAEYLAFFASSNNGPSKIEINGGKYHTTLSNLLGVHGGSITVKDGEFNCDNADKTFKFYNVTGGTIVLEGGTFNGVAFADLTEEVIRSWCNLSECENGVEVVFANGAWTITVK